MQFTDDRGKSSVFPVTEPNGGDTCSYLAGSSVMHMRQNSQYGRKQNWFISTVKKNTLFSLYCVALAD